MKIIDINCMLGSWPEKHKHFRQLDDLLREMHKYRISECIAFHSMSLWSPIRGNGLIKNLADETQGKVKPCYVLDPLLSSGIMQNYNKLIKKLSAEKPVAVRLYPNLNNFKVDEFYCGELLDLLSKLNIPVIFAPDEMPSFENLPSLAKNWPGINFIILRHGFRESRYIIPIIRKLNNVFFDTSIMADTGVIEEIVSKYGSEKLLFGSGMPFYPPTGALSLIIYAKIKNEDKENILSKNWMRIEGGLYENHRSSI